MNKYTPEPPRQQTYNPALTTEKFEQIKSELNSENLAQFPSAFQVARNLLKQVWTSSIDVAKGQPLLTTPEKAGARMDICKACLFFREPRCTKCGCFMDKKVHIESAQCPVNKWGPELQKMYPDEAVKANLEGPRENMPIVDIFEKFPKKDAEAIDQLAEESLKFDGRFSWNKMEFKAFIAPDGVRKILQLRPKNLVQALIPDSKLSVEEQVEFNQILLKHQAPDKEKVFAYKSRYFYLTPRTDKDAKPGQFVLTVLDPQNLPSGITLPGIKVVPTTQ